MGFEEGEGVGGLEMREIRRRRWKEKRGFGGRGGLDRGSLV